VQLLRSFSYQGAYAQNRAFEDLKRSSVLSGDCADNG
jgi:hypothetical protein